MTLYNIHTMGIQCHCSDLIIDPNDMETIYFMSVCGYQVAVKGLVANFLENSGISVKVNGEDYDLVRSDMAYNVQMKKLPSGLVHAVVIPKLALPKNDEEKQNRFFVITKEDQDVLTLFFRHLDEKTEIPLHPSWASWLWTTFKKQEGWFIALQTLVGDFEGHLFDYHPTRLHDLISGAIRKKVPEIVGCLSWKGGNGDGTNTFA
jgi:hypothetical protein